MQDVFSMLLPERDQSRGKYLIDHNWKEMSP